ncbi:DUF6668 family protein [Yinghuangia soli]|uniref:Uncharacterized protein n=1 Tax=Yinghuangia soli TaxID=2908204 RepID=A0AA41PW52_9ACTN|nr:DUF6668 family protein [Yinghuangia soli]MCF2526717.1 hypothetical protein [Yinghuangia soli]
MANPWVTAPADPPPSADKPKPVRRGRSSPPRAPQASVVPALDRGGMDVWDAGPAELNPPWWWVGCHGGAGVGTLNALLPGGADGGRGWPVASDGGITRVILVSRSNATGLHAAQLASRQWASGAVPSVVLLGLAVIADAPGRPPKPLADLLTLVGGGFPHVWSVPWIEQLRLGELPPLARLPKPLHRLGTDLSSLLIERGPAVS